MPFVLRPSTKTARRSQGQITCTTCTSTGGTCTLATCAMSMLQRGLRGALRSVPSASTARVGGLRMQSSISYVPRNLGRPALHLRACGAAVPPRASVRLASTLVAKPEHPEDETVMEGDTPLVHLTERAVQVRTLS